MEINDEINEMLNSILVKTKNLIKENLDLRSRISQLESEAISFENKINLLNNKISEDKEKQQQNKELVKELLNEIEECYSIYSNDNE
ncbi:MAG: hypothetical protein ACOX4D_02915 [Bacteroidales bacterium]